MKFRFQIIFSAILWVGSPLLPPFSFGQEGPAAPNVASYRIDVELDTDEKKLYGNEIITFVNISNTPLDTLCIHLYPNAFRHEKTTFMKECPRWYRRRVAKRKKWGSMEIINIETTRGKNLTDSKIIDETVMKVPVPQPLPPGQKIELRIEFTVTLPRIIARMGYRGEHYSVGQWFPKMCALRPDGSWVAHQYHFTSEFFANFGTYDVSITVPEGYIVGATGYLEEETADGGGTKTLQYHAESVHDFYWEADPDFTVTQERCGDVEVSFLCLPDHRRKIPRVMKAACAALYYYGEWYGPYPYKRLVITDSYLGAGRGMEYPMIVAVTLSWFFPESIRWAEALIIHEIGHQWWYGVVASNEFEEPWLDEGINTYCTRKVLEALYGKDENLVRLFGLTLSHLQYNKAIYLMAPKRDPIVKNSWEFEDFVSYGATVYGKASLMLETLEGYLGQEVMRRILRAYFERFSFRHPKTEDFIETAEEVSSQDLDRFFEPWLYSTGVCDYAVTSIESRRTNPEEGADGFTAQRYRTKVRVERRGEAIMPVEVLIELEDGQTIAKDWDGADRWVEYEIETGSKIRSAAVDPDNKILLDVDTNNNGLTTKSQRLALFKIGSHLLFSWETLIQWLTAF